MRASSHSYAFQGFPGRMLFTGCTANGGQLLVGPLSDLIVALEFDQRGILKGIRERALDELTDYSFLEIAVSRFFQSLQPVPGAIHIRRLVSDIQGGSLWHTCQQYDVDIHIADYPLGLEDPEGYILVEQDPDEYLAQRQQWLASGCYVLDWCGDELYVDGEGKVIST